MVLLTIQNKTLHASEAHKRNRKTVTSHEVHFHIMSASLLPIFRKHLMLSTLSSASVSSDSIGAIEMLYYYYYLFPPIPSHHCTYIACKQSRQWHCHFEQYHYHVVYFLPLNFAWQAASYTVKHVYFTSIKFSWFEYNCEIKYMQTLLTARQHKFTFIEYQYLAGMKICQIKLQRIFYRVGQKKPDCF